MTPKLLTYKRTNGIAGQFAIDVTVDWGDGEPTAATFIGSTYGGSPVMIVGNVQTFVSPNVNYGDFATDPRQWVERFIAN